MLGRSVTVLPPGEYVALGAARQAAWVLAGTDAPPDWALTDTVELEAPATPVVRERYAALRDAT